jgi:hypothetical protein
MSNFEKIDLKQFLDNNSNYVDNTEHIRNLKHSTSIRDAVRTIENLKVSHSLLKESDNEAFVELCKSECRFLYDGYTDLFHKLVKDELDLTIMTKLLTVLKLIEDGKVDQNDGSVMVGKILKELYVDSAMKRADALDKEHDAGKQKPINGKPISWSEYKKYTN